ncbi:hypothetical protein [Variovorax guangxiensis]|uniref:hypothetical protein n=1 Tax=Variovorax guangxiensis TaxID=1775474 RepID=UPI0028557642|nr:hypothetical protein [Variovorax guangxiensis]MDR6855305.1 hypothetical protein [Variovorax guangxiensis]
MKTRQQAVPHDDPERTTPFGMTRFANDFFLAALAVVDRIPAPRREALAPGPALYLIGHSIELASKAYLIHKGVSLETLRKKHGHSLHRSMKKANELGFVEFARLDPAEDCALQLLDSLYATKQLEYIVTGFRRNPPLTDLQRAAAKILRGAALGVGYPRVDLIGVP